MAVCLSTASSSSDCDSSSSVLDDVMDGQCLRLWILKEPIFLMTTIYPCYSSMSLIKKGEGGVFYFVLRLTGMQRVKGGSSLLSFLSAPLIKKKALNTLGAVQDTYFSTKDTFERHRVVFTLGTSIASVATAWAGYSLRHYHETNFDRRLESIEKAMKNNYHFEHADIKKIVDQESSRSAFCFATSATTLIIGYALGWRGGKWYANRKFKREQMKLLGQIKPKRWQLLSQVKPKGWKLQFLKRPLSRSRAPESAHKTISEGSVC